MFISGSYVGLVPYYTALEIIKKKKFNKFFFSEQKNEMGLLKYWRKKLKEH